MSACSCIADHITTHTVNCGASIKISPSSCTVPGVETGAVARAASSVVACGGTRTVAGALVSGSCSLQVAHAMHYTVLGALQRSVMEIDDRWQSAYGNLDFDTTKFPDAPGMVRQLHAMGFKITVWVMPFVEEKSAAYR